MKEKICLFFKVFCIATLFVVSASCGIFVKNAFADDNFVTNAAGSCSVDVLGVSDDSAVANLIAVYELQSYKCLPGTYLNVDENTVACDDCPVNSWCPGGVFTVKTASKSQNLCPDGYYTKSENSTSKSDCIADCDWNCTGEACAPCLSEKSGVFTAVTPLMSAGDEFSFELSAAGDYTINWGDGNIETITKTDVEIDTVSHQYEGAGQYHIEISGIATEYSTTYPAISFQCKNERGEYITSHPLAGIGGTLGSIFSSIDDNTQPLFTKTFYGCDTINNTVIPSALFKGITGNPVKDMFAYTFYGVSGLTTIPEGLFSGLSGAPAESMFEFTFANTGIETIPSDLLGGISGAPAKNMFKGTFSNTKITEIPENLFSTITNDKDNLVAEYMFANTFEGTQITSIPAGLFSSISGKPASGMFSNTFAFTKVTTIPPLLFQSISGEPAPYMFERTFAHTPITNIPDDLFVNISGTPANGMFASTFEACSSLSGQIPGTLFSGIKGTPANSMFASTFYNATGLSSYIPPELFKDIDATDFQPGQMKNVFLGTDIVTQCPENMMQYITGFEADFDSKVSCIQCPEHSSTRGMTGQTSCLCDEGYYSDTETETVTQNQSCVIIPTYTVTYECADGTVVADSVTTETVKHGSTFVLNAAICTTPGKTQTGWQVKDTETVYSVQESIVYDFKNDITLVAVYSPELFTITYNCDDGTEPTTQDSVYFGSEYTPRNSDICQPKPGYTFNGWLVGNTQIPYNLHPGTTYTYTFWESKTFTAVWTPDCNKITLDTTTYGGNEYGIAAVYKKTASPIVYSDELCENVLDSLNEIPTKTNATFQGFYKNDVRGPQCIFSSGSFSSMNDCNPNAPTTWYAIYKCDENYAGHGPNTSGQCTPTVYTISYMCDGYTHTEEVEYGAEYTPYECPGYGYTLSHYTVSGTSDTRYVGQMYTYTYTEDKTFSPVWMPNYSIMYDCGDGTGTPPETQIVYTGATFIPRTNTCVKDGYELDYWKTTNGGLTDKYYPSTEYTYKYGTSVTFTAVYKAKTYTPEVNTEPLIITVVPLDHAESSLTIYFNAKGVFKIDWDDGTIETLNNTNVYSRSLTHSFNAGNSGKAKSVYYVKIYGLAEDYEKTTNPTDKLLNPVIKIGCGSRSPKVTDVTGSLGMIFPTLSDDRQPSFQGTFENCQYLKYIDQDNLFKGVTGMPRAYMFARTFANTALEGNIYNTLFKDIGGENSTVPGLFAGTFYNSKISSVDASVFDNIKGAPKLDIFNSTFMNCKNLHLHEGQLLFKNISGAPAPYMFSSTFAGTLIATIPTGLFDNISGAPAPYMFNLTFAGTPITTIPTSLFDNIYGAAAESIFAGTFKDTQITSIPTNLFSGIIDKPAKKMFFETFRNTPITSIPEQLFWRLDGAPAESMFDDTFNGCTRLTGTLPETLFQGVRGGPAKAMFNGTFMNTGITGIPGNLFANIQGSPAQDMFQSTFRDTKIKSIPSNLFSGITGQPADGMFWGTFWGTPITKIPDGLFSGIKGTPAPNMFAQTFMDCRDIKSQIPENLFENIRGPLAKHSFYQTFAGIVPSRYNVDSLWGQYEDGTYNFIPNKLFDKEKIYGANNTNEAMTNVFGNVLDSNNNVVSTSGLLEHCPSMFKRYDTGFEDWFKNPKSGNKKISCTPCPEHASHREGDEYQCECLKGYSPDGNPVATETADNLKEGETCQPIKYIIHYRCGSDATGREFTETVHFAQEGYKIADMPSGQCTPKIPNITFARWHLNDSPSVKYIPGSEVTWNVYSADKHIWLNAEYELNPEFTLTTKVDAGAKYTIKIAASGTFYIDWGDGSGITQGTPWSNAGWSYNHTYNKTGTYSIRIAGDATGYPNLDDNVGIKSVIDFGGLIRNAETITGSLGNIFPTLSNGSQPKFQEVFKNATNLSSIIPGNLFTGTKKSDGTYPVHGTPRDSMFESAFENCSNIPGRIPSTLFASIKGQAKALYKATFKNCYKLSAIPYGLFGIDVISYTNPSSIKSDVFAEMFKETFSGCTGLKGVIPSYLFGPFTVPADEMFGYTFYNCSGLSGAIPNNLFQNLSGTPGHAMFDRTFHGCAGLTSIPNTLFRGLTGTAPWLFNGTFQGCTNITAIPSGLFGLAGTNTLKGNQQPEMFKETFRGCTGLNAQLPDSLFPNISGVSSKGTQRMFQYTFYDCHNLSGTIPGNLFGEVNVPGYAMFDRTFHNCYSLSGPIPADLFGKLSGKTTDWLFNGVFANCTNLNGPIPAKLFSGLWGKPAENSFKEAFIGSGVTGYIYPGLFANLDDEDYTSGPMKSIFYNTNLLTKCPEDMYEVRSNFEVDWDGKKSCSFCPMGEWQDPTDPTKCMVRKYTLNYDCNGGRNTPPESQNVIYQQGVKIQANTCEKPGSTFEGWYFNDKSDEILNPGLNYIYSYTKDNTLYAKWRQNTYAYTLDANHYMVSNVDNQTIVTTTPSRNVSPSVIYTQFDATKWFANSDLSQGSTITKLTNIPKLDNYVFTGFTTTKFPTKDTIYTISSDGTLNTPSITASTQENTTLYAQYTQCNCNPSVFAFSGVDSCEVTGVTDDNQCIYEVSCADGYYIENTTVITSDTSYSPICNRALVYKITLNSNYYSTADSTEGNQATTPATPDILYLRETDGWYKDSPFVLRVENPISELTQIPSYMPELYTFNGFYTGKAGTGTKVIDDSGKLLTTSDILNNTFNTGTTIYAHYVSSPSLYNVTFSCGEGEGVPPKTMLVGYNSGVIIPPNTNCVMTNKEFIGWSVSGTNDVLYPSQKLNWPYTSDKILTAKYADTTYNIEYDSNNANATGNAPISPTICIIGESCFVPENTFDVIGYRFAGWKCSGNSKCEEEGFVLTPGYDLGILNHTADETITLIAQWEPASFTINYNSAGGVGTDPSLTLCEYGQVCTVPENPYIKKGYNFVIWSYQTDTGHVGLVGPNSDLASLFSTNLSSVTLTATWDGMGIFINYNDNGGTQVNPDTPIEPTYCKYGSTCIIPENPYQKENYIFTGWKCSGDVCADTQNLIKPATDLSSILSDDISNGDVIELIAQWTEKPEEKFFITYLPGTDEYSGSAPASPTECLLSSTDCFAPTNTFLRNGYKFAGWLCSGEEANCAGFVLSEGESLQNASDVDGGIVYLTAQWEPIKFNVTYNRNGGAGVFASQTCTYDQDCFIPDGIPSKFGYNFKHWCEVDDCPVVYNPGDNLRNFTNIDNANVVMNAMYDKIEFDYYLEYYKDENSTEPFYIQTCSLHEPCTALDAIEKEGYKFNTWKCSGNVLCNGEKIAANSDLTNVSADGSTVILTGVWTPNTFNIIYDGNGATELSGTLKPTVCEYDQNCFIPDNAYIYDGYTFIDWQCSIDGVACNPEHMPSGTNIKNITADDNTDVVLKAYWMETPEFPFQVTTTSDTTEFAFSINATGTFYVDWGDGTSFETITISDTSGKEILHTYQQAGTYVIKIGGAATGYGTSDDIPTISFTANKNVKYIDGILGAIFSTLPDGTQPSFFDAFYGCTNLTGELPEELFVGISGIGRPRMFGYTFADTDIQTIPDTLFAPLESALTNQMFAYTFTGCDKLTSIPALFDGFTTSAPRAFQGTFSNCTALESIPENLFGITDNPSDYMFAETFAGCTNLKTIPENLFSTISGAPGEYAFQDTFAATGITEIPSALFSKIDTPSKGLFNGTFTECVNLTSVPSELFKNIKQPSDSLFANTFSFTGLTSVPDDLFTHMSGEPTPNMFESTFAYSDIESAIPANLFGNITGMPAESMMAHMFERSSATSYINPNLFKNFTNTDYTPGPMSLIFQDTNMSEVCPTNMRQYITGFESDFSGKVSCIECPANSMQRTDDMTYCQCYDGYSIDGTQEGEIYTQSVDCQPIKYNATYSCGDGSGTAPESQQITHGDNFVFAENTGCSYEGYTFTGWENTELNISKKPGDIMPWNWHENIEFTAKYVKNVYTITFDKMGGTGGTDSVTVEHNAYPPDIEVPTMLGHDFIGYYDGPIAIESREYYEADGKAVSVWDKADATLYAAYFPKSYNYLYNCGEGSGTAPEGGIISYNQALTFADNTCIAPNGYVFDKWLEPDSDDVYSAGETTRWLYIDNKTFVATYVPGEYTVTFHSNYEPETTSVQTFVYNQEYRLKAFNQRIGYTFMGYAKTPDGTVGYKPDEIVSNLTDVPGGNVDLYAIWEPFSVYFEYESNGGTKVEPDAPINPSVCSGDDLCFAPENPYERPGYIFTGWTCSGHVFCDNGLFNAGTDLRTVIIESASPNETITMTAQWKPIRFTVVYNVNDGTPEIETQTCTYDQDCFVSDVVPEKIGHVFNNWGCASDDTDSECNNAEIEPSANIMNITNIGAATVTLTANYTPNTYTITYNANGGAGTMEPTTFEYGESVSLSPNAFTRDGYGFIGWATTSDGVVEYSDTQTVSNLTDNIDLYAVWEQTMCAVYEYAPTSAITGLEPLADMATNSNGAIYYDSSVSAYKFKDNGMELYDANQEFTVKFANGTLTGLAFCGVNGSYKLYNTTSKFNYYQTGRGCWCRYGVDHVNDSGWKWQRATNFSNVDMCRSECPMVCAQLVAEDTQFRANLLADSGTEEYDALLNGDCPSDNLVSKCDNRVGYTYTYNEDTNECSYTPITYTVTYNANEGTGEMTPDTFTYDVAGVLSENTFERTGYTFAGWATEPDGEMEYENNAVVLNWAKSQGANIDLYALWTPITYTVTYNANGGTGNMETMTFNYGDDVTLAQNTFTRDGYEFNGWSTTTDGELEYTDGQVISGLTGDVTLYAVWLPIYTITYNANGGIGEMPQTEFASGTTVTLAQNTFTRDGYEFNGWSTSDNGEVEYTDGQVISGLTGDIILYAVWTELATQTYTITYNANGGAGNMESTTFNYGDDVTLSSNTFTRSEYSFAGWATTPDGEKVYSDAQTISGLANNLDLYAVWLVTQCTVTGYAPTVTLTDLETIENITANSGGGIVKKSGVYYFETSEGVALYNQGQEFTVDFSHGSITGTALCGVNGGSAYNQAGHIMDKLNGWQAGKGCWCRYGTSTDEVYTVTLDDGSTKTYPWGRAYTAELASSVDACRAECPRVCAEKVATDTTFRKNLLLIDTECPPDNMLSPCDPQEGYTASYDKDTDECSYTPITYTVTYNANEGTGEMTPDTFTYDVAGVLSENTFERTGYTFAGWATTSDGEMEYENNAVVLNWAKSQGANIDLYALWTPITYTVTYNANGGTGNMESMTFNYGDDVTLAQNTFTRDGYEFNGWSTSANGATEYSDGQKISGLTGDVTLYAVWLPIYTITYNANGGIGEMSQTEFASGTTVTLAQNTFTRDGYEFNGWSTSANGATEYSDGQKISGLTGDITLYAVWTELATPVSGYTVIYSCGTGEGGAAPATTTVEYGTEFTPAANTCEKKCNTFIGWQISDTDIVTTSSFTWTYTTNKVLTAQWSEEECDEGGATTCDPSTCPTTNVTPTSAISAKTASELASANIIGPSITTSTKINNMAAYVEDQRWSVTFANSGKTINGFAICGPSGRAANAAGHTTSGSKYLLAKALTANQAYYGCYCKSGDNITDDTLYASLKQLKPSGTTTPAQKIDYCRANCPYECANAVATDAIYRKAMLADSTDSVCECSENSGDEECCEPNPNNETFKIHMFTDVYTKIGETSVTYNQAISGLLTPEQANKVFVGWFDEDGVQYSNGDTYTKQTDTIVYARWEDVAVQYTVAYNANGGSGDMESSVFTYGIAGTLRPNTFTRTDYNFLGWARSSEATTPEYTDKAEVIDWSNVNGDIITLYAVWQEIPATYTVTYHANEGTGEMTQSTFNMDVEYNLPLNEFTRTGYTFKHWATNSDGSGNTYSDGQNVTNLTTTRGANVDLYAVWQPDIYTITYMSNGGLSADYSLNIEFGANMPNIDIPTPADGYIFTGYYLEPTGETQYYDATGTPVSTYAIYNRTENLVLYAGWKTKACEPTGNYSPTSALTDVPTISELYNAGFLKYQSANVYTFVAENNGMAKYNSSQRFTFEYSDGVNTTNVTGTAFCGPNGSGDRTKLYYTTDKLSVYQTGKGCWCRYGLSDDEVYKETLDDGSTKTYPWQRAATPTDVETCRTTCPMICAQYAATDEKFRTNLLNGDTISCTDDEIECPAKEGYTGIYNTQSGECEYAPNTYTITLDPDGGATTQTSISVEYNTAIPSAEVPTLDGYLFMGYYTEKSGAGDKFFDEFGAPVSETYTLASDITVYAYWKEPACTDYDGTVLERCDEPILSAQEMVDNGMLEYKNTSVYKITDFDKYMRNQKWAVNFPTYGAGTGTISGSAFCGPINKAEYGTKVKSIEEYGYNQSGSTIKQAHAGCWCQVGPTDTTKFWIAAGKYDESESWAENTDACRANCPEFCAQLVATDSNFRTLLYGDAETCPVGTNHKKSCCDGEYETEAGTYEKCPDGSWCQSCQKNDCDTEAMYTATLGATSPNACGTYLHVGEHKIFMRPNAKMTELALHVNKRGTIFHANMSTEKPNDGKEKHLQTLVDGIKYYIFDNLLI